MLECYQDQFVSKTIEYLACHKPVIATQTRFTKKLNKELGGNSILLTDGTVEDMKKKILECHSYIKLFYTKKNINIIKKYLSTISYKENVRSKLLPVYREILHNEKNHVYIGKSI
jgi:hypothetical protein